jgi:hypothetical protein
MFVLVLGMCARLELSLLTARYRAIRDTGPNHVLPLPLDRHPEDVCTPYMCRTEKARHLKRFIVGLLLDLEVGVGLQLNRQMFIVNVRLFSFQRYEH